MKSTIKFIIAAFAASMVFSSCTKDDQTEVGGGSNFTADIEQGLTRTTLIDNQYIGWYYGDKVAINGTLYSASPKGKVATSADLIYVGGNIPAAPYKAIYPASLYDAGTGMYAFPETQEYQEGRFNAPMYAESNSKSLQFRNICGVLRFALRGNEKVRSIVISSYYNQLYGPFIIDANGNASLDVQEKQVPPEQVKGGRVSFNNPYGHVCLDCGEEGVQLYENMARNFYVYLPAQTYVNGMDVIITTTNGVETVKTASQNITLEANTLYTFNWDINMPEEEPTVEEALTKYFSDMAKDQAVLTAATDEAMKTMTPSEITASQNNPESFFLPEIHTWDNACAAIKAIDKGLDQLDNEELPDAQRYQKRGELKFFRALLYFELFKTYGTAPSAADGYQTQLPSKEVFSMIIQDAEEGMKLLPKQYDSDKTITLDEGVEITRPTYFAAEALMARTYLYASSSLFGIGVSKQESIKYCEEIIASGYYGLMTNYSDLWGNSAFSNKELIFGVHFTTPSSAYNGIHPTAHMNKSFDSADVRLASTIGTTGDGLILNKPVDEV